MNAAVHCSVGLETGSWVFTDVCCREEQRKPRTHGAYSVWGCCQMASDHFGHYARLGRTINSANLMIFHLQWHPELWHPVLIFLSDFWLRITFTISQFLDTPWERFIHSTSCFCESCIQPAAMPPAQARDEEFNRCYSLWHILTEAGVEEWPIVSYPWKDVYRRVGVWGITVHNAHRYHGQLSANCTPETQTQIASAPYQQSELRALLPPGQFWWHLAASDKSTYSDDSGLMREVLYTVRGLL